MLPQVSRDPLPFELRAAVYNLLARLFLAPPDAALLHGLSDPALLVEWPQADQSPLVRQALDQFLATLYNAQPDALKAEYQALFLGPGPIAAPLWESVYRDREHVIFGEQTLQVRALFRRFGVAPRQLHREPDDHLGLQLQFLAHLADLAARTVAEADEPELGEIFAGERICIEEHLLQFLPQLAQRIEQHGGSEFYKRLTTLTLAVLQHESDWNPSLGSRDPSLGSRNPSKPQGEPRFGVEIGPGHLCDHLPCRTGGQDTTVSLTTGLSTCA